jgi:hypothetical protein
MELTIILVILLILGFAGCGIFLIYSGLTIGRRVNRNTPWPGVKGRVISSEVVESSGMTQEGIPFSSFKPVTRFTYIVDGVEYISIQIGRAVQKATDESLQQMANQFPVGKEIIVHFDPKNPSEAILAPNTPIVKPVVSAGIVLVILSVLFTCIGAGTFLYYFFTH